MNETEQNNEENANWKTPENAEAKRLPSEEEIQSGFELVAGKDYTETKKVNGAEGIKDWEITTPGKEPGEVNEYSYNRSSTTGHGEINVIFYGDDGFPVSAELSARFENGAWKIIDNTERYEVNEYTVPRPKKPNEIITEKREAAEEMQTLEVLFTEFEKAHPLKELMAITNLTWDEAVSHPVREPARLDLVRIKEHIKTLQAETNMSEQELATVNARYAELAKAVGHHITGKNIIEH